jgi:hypothetical protein
VATRQELAGVHANSPRNWRRGGQARLIRAPKAALGLAREGFRAASSHWAQEVPRVHFPGQAVSCPPCWAFAFPRQRSLSRRSSTALRPGCRLARAAGLEHSEAPGSGAVREGRSRAEGHGIGRGGRAIEARALGTPLPASRLRSTPTSPTRGGGIVFPAACAHRYLPEDIPRAKKIC